MTSETGSYKALWLPPESLRSLPLWEVSSHVRGKLKPSHGDTHVWMNHLEMVPEVTGRPSDDYSLAHILTAASRETEPEDTTTQPSCS